MKKIQLSPTAHYLFLFVLLIFYTNCTKNDIKSSKDNMVSDNKNSNEIVKNFIPTYGPFIQRNPSPSGFKNRKQLKSLRQGVGTTWYAQSGSLSSSFDTQGGAYSAVLALQ